MLPPIIERRIGYAEAVAANLRETASECRPDQETLRVRWIQAAQTIDEMVALVRSTAIVAKWNHDTILNIAQAYREAQA